MNLQFFLLKHREREFVKLLKQTFLEVALNNGESCIDVVV